MDLTRRVPIVAQEIAPRKDLGVILPGQLLGEQGGRNEGKLIGGFKGGQHAPDKRDEYGGCRQAQHQIEEKPSQGKFALCFRHLDHPLSFQNTPVFHPGALDFKAKCPQSPSFPELRILRCRMVSTNRTTKKTKASAEAYPNWNRVKATS